MRPPEFTRDALREQIETYGYEIGEYTFGKPAVWSIGHGHLKIGRFCSIAPQVEILMIGGDHNPAWVTTSPPENWLPVPRGFRKGRRYVTIGNDVWLGQGCTIMADVTVGDGAVVGARAIVTKDFEPYTIVAGNPARPVRKRFREDQIAALLDIRWWDWPIEKVIEFGPLIQGDDIDAFIAKAQACQVR
jgi:acetyltransferase-like isoleucine patch superfamily enzyme